MEQLKFEQNFDWTSDGNIKGGKWLCRQLESCEDKALSKLVKTIKLPWNNIFAHKKLWRVQQFNLTSKNMWALAVKCGEKIDNVGRI